MAIDHLSDLHGLPVFNFVDSDAEGKPLPAADRVAWRLSQPETDKVEFDDCWNRFLATVDTSQVRALVLGASAYGDEYGTSAEATAEELVAAADRLTGLKALFLGDLIDHECMLSWIVQSDVALILSAYPGLEELGVRGSSGPWNKPGLRLTPLRHEHLRTLRLENCGLPAEVVRGLVASELPALHRLDLWLGSEYYGRSTTVEDLSPLLDGGRLPALRHLGLQNADIQNEVAAAVAHAPIVARLESLHLGLGTLDDTGAQALLDGQPLTHLDELDLHHHFLSEDMMGRLREALEPAGVRVNLEGRQEPDEEEEEEEEESRYLAAGE